MKNKKYIFLIFIVLILVAIDQVVKLFVSTNMELFESIPIIKDVFEITYIHNTGAAWGMFSGRIGILICITAIVILGCFYIINNLVELKETKYVVLRWSIVFLISGALGNMIDRVRLGYVVDYLYFKLIDFPVFNIADIYVVCSIIIIFFMIIFKLNNDDIDFLTTNKKQSKENKTGTENEQK